jgi:hypothetical protein
MERVWDGVCAEDAISVDVARDGGEDCGRIQRNAVICFGQTIRLFADLKRREERRNAQSRP